MTREQEERIAAEVMDNLNLSEDKERTVRRYIRRAVDKILIYCNRDDLPARLETTAAQIAEDMLAADHVAEGGKDVSSITRGDTSITYGDGASGRAATVDFMKNYQSSLNLFRKMNLPKDVES